MQPDQTDPIILMEGVSKSFGDFRALKDVSLEVAAGERVVVCGPSGSGKSTLIRTINRLERHEAGRITLAGVELDDGRASREAVRAGVGMVFQQFNLFPHLTVLGNLTIGPVRARGLSEREARELAMRYLERVHIPEQADKYPRALSGGQQQRVAIARAIVSDPKMLLCDEPTGDLDRQTANEILSMLQVLNRDHGKTIVMVTHDPEAAKYAKRILHLDKGQFVEQGAL